MKKRIMFSVSCLALFLSASAGLMAAGKKGFEFSENGRFVRATEVPSHITPPPQEDANLKVIAGNFSVYPKATYFSVWGNTIDQGVNNYPFQVWEAMAFTPKADATVTKIETSAGRQGTGTAGFELALYDDASGVPGKAIKSFHVSNLPPYGQCCAVSTANDKAGIPVKAGTQYWVVVRTTAQDVNVYAWAFNSSDMTPQLSAFWCKGTATYCGKNSGKWTAYQYVALGFNVLGH